MFSSGKLLFALIFIIVFVIAISFQYYKDRQKSKTLFKGTYIVLIAVIALMITYVLLSKLNH